MTALIQETNYDDLTWLTNMTLGAFDNFMRKFTFKERLSYTIGAPKATASMTVGEIAAQGYVGVYTRKE